VLPAGKNRFGKREHEEKGKVKKILLRGTRKRKVKSTWESINTSCIGVQAGWSTSFTKVKKGLHRHGRTRKERQLKG